MTRPVFVVVCILTNLAESNVVHRPAITSQAAFIPVASKSSKKTSVFETTRRQADSAPRKRTPWVEAISFSRYLGKEDDQADDSETVLPSKAPTWTPSPSIDEDQDSLYSPISTTIPKGLTTIVPSAPPIQSPPTMAPTSGVPSMLPSTKLPSLRPTTRSPSQNPTSFAPSIVQSSQTPTKTTSQAPTSIPHYVFLHEFEIRMRFDSMGDNAALLSVWSDRLRIATEAYLLERLPFDTIQSVQLYAIDTRRKLNEQQPQHTFRYGGVAVFRGNTPEQSELQLQQRLVIRETRNLQHWYRQRYSILDAWVLSTDFVSDAPNSNTTDQTKEESGIRPKHEEISYLIIAGASGAAVVAILLLVCALCWLCRGRRDVVVADTVQKFHPNDRTFSDDDSEKISPRRAKSCMMQIVDVDRRTDQRPLVLPRKLLCALPSVNDESSCVSGYSLGSHLQPSSSPQPKTLRYRPTAQLTTHQEGMVSNELAPKTKVPTVADLRGKNRPLSWANANGDDAVSSIHESDASHFSATEKFQDTDGSQYDRGLMLGSSAEVMANSDTDYDDELVHSLHRRSFDDRALLDEARTSERKQQEEPKVRPENHRVETIPFDETSNRDIHSTSEDNFDSVASKLEQDIAKLKDEIVGRRKTSQNAAADDDANDSESSDDRVAKKYGSVRVHR